MEAQPLLTTYEAARYLGVSAGTLANWRCRGKGPPFVKIEPADLSGLSVDLCVASGRRSGPARKTRR
jgi:hypothetical protein